jgi:hypothetical protein
MKAIIKRFKSRTYLVGLLMAALTIVEANEQIIASLVPPKYQPYMPLIFPLVMLFMREITKTPIADK